MLSLRNFWPFVDGIYGQRSTAAKLTFFVDYHVIISSKSKIAKAKLKIETFLVVVLVTEYEEKVSDLHLLFTFIKSV